jgi:hypothetical protein
MCVDVRRASKKKSPVETLQPPPTCLLPNGQAPPVPAAMPSPIVPPAPEFRHPVLLLPPLGRQLRQKEPPPQVKRNTWPILLRTRWGRRRSWGGTHGPSTNVQTWYARSILSWRTLGSEATAWSFMSFSVNKTSTTAHWPTLLNLFFSGTYRLSLSHTEKKSTAVSVIFSQSAVNAKKRQIKQWLSLTALISVSFCPNRQKKGPASFNIWPIC